MIFEGTKKSIFFWSGVDTSRAEYARMLTPGTDYMNELAGILGELGYEKTIVV